MNIEQIYTGCLAQGAYYIESEGEAAIIDPLREVEPYLKKARARGSKIKYIFETHFHADFVSGHLSLAEKTGAPIVYGPTAEPAFKAHIARDGEEFKLGRITLVVLHTPGHTMESVTYLLRDENGKDRAIFTGDTLFLGDVGRPDLAQKSSGHTQEDLAGMLYDSLRNKIMPLADDITVYPAHGAGSACGKNMMNQTVDSLGNQKEINYALRADMTRQEFIKEVTAGLLPPPGYFPLNVQMNRDGYASIDEVLQQGTRALSPEEFEATAKGHGALILDVRHQNDFMAGHIPGSVFIGLDGNFAPWVGAMIRDVQTPLLLVVPTGRHEEAVTRLARVGFDHSLGYLKGGINAWQASGRPVKQMGSINSRDLAGHWPDPQRKLIDVRRVTEHRFERVPHSQNLPLDDINDQMQEFPEDKEFYVHCAGGYRSVIAGSILMARGKYHPINVNGGMSEMRGILPTEVQSEASPA